MNNIIRLCVFSSLLLQSGYALAQEKNENKGEYLNSNNILSSIAYEVADSLSERLNDREVKIVEKFKKEVNEKLLTDGLNQIVYFKTAGDEVNERSYNYLSNLVLSLDNYKDLTYTLEGYADVRGDKDYNFGLSKDRIDAIKQILTEIGVPFSNIKEVNYGEQKSEERINLEDYFYDRRVEIKITL